MNRTAIVCAAALAFSTAGQAAPDKPESCVEVSSSDGMTIAAAVAASDRPEAAQELDESRKPADVLFFLGIQAGMVAGDLFPGSGYWAEIMGHIVGPEGAVVSYQPAPWGTGEEAVAARNALEERVPNVSQSRYVFDQFDPPAESMDFALINLSYHDIYWESERFQIPFTNPDDYVAALYAGMKPGGIVGVIDHVGEGTDTRTLVDKYHRIDPDVVRADFERAGFVLEAASDILANPDDPHDISVFDPAIRGKTDRFLFKFRKPR